MKKLISIFVCVLMLCTVFVACDTAETDQPAAPVTVDDYIKIAREYMEKTPYKCETTEEKIIGGSLLGNTTTNDKETYSSFVDGRNVKEITSIEGITSTFTITDNTFYLEMGNIKKKMNIDTNAMDEEIKALVSNSGKSTESLMSFKYKDVQITKNDDGTTTIVGKGFDPSESEIIADIFSGLDTLLGLVGGSMNYDSMTLILVFDDEYHLISQEYYAESSASSAVSIEITKTEKFEYGDQFKVEAPKDADSYELVDSLFQ